MSEESKSESEFDELKSDCLIEILSRLSVKSLIRCTCVSKGWLSIIRSPEFIAKHYDFHRYNTQQNSILAVFKPGCSISILCAQNLTLQTAFKFRPAVVYDPPLYQIYHRDVIGEFYVEGPCNGLFLINFVKAGFPCHNPVLLLWNPATREVFKLPLIDIDIVDNNNIVDHFTCCLTYGFGFDTVNRDYKVVGLYAVINNRIDNTIVCLYSLATNSWTRLYHAYDRISTQLDDVSHNIHPPYSFINGIPIQNDKGGYKYYVTAPCSHDRSTSSSNGRMHNWIAMHKPGYKYLLLSFDMVDEVLVQTPLPPGVLAGGAGVGFLSHGSDYPCLFSFTNEQHLHIWLLQDYGPMGVWNKILDISVPESDWRTTMYAAILWNNNHNQNQNQNENQLVFSRGEKLFSFTMTTKQTTSLGIPGDAAVIAYTESLVPIAKSVRQQQPSEPTINIIHHSNQQDDDDDDDDDRNDSSSSSSSMDSAFLTPDITPFFHYDTIYIDMETDMEFGPRRHNEVNKLSNLPYCLREVNRPMVSNPCTF